MVRKALVIMITLLWTATMKAAGMGSETCDSMILTSYSNASADRTISNMKMAGVGMQSLLDTYLSQEHYHGTALAYTSLTERSTEGTPWYRTIANMGSLAQCSARSTSGNMLSGAYDFEYGVMRRFTVAALPLTVSVGGQAHATIGFIYNTRGGNNTGQARAALSVGPSASARYDAKRVAIQLNVSMPLLGAAFSPNYGQSYYEIFSEGNYDHNIVAATVVNMPSLNSSLTASFHWLNTQWVVGWQGQYQQFSANHLKQHLYTNSLLIGIRREIHIR